MTLGKRFESKNSAAQAQSTHGNHEMSKTSINRTIRLPNELDSYLESVILETGRTRSELVLESIKSFRAGAVAQLQAPGLAGLESKLDALLGIVGQQADQISALTSKVTELADEAPVNAHTHRLVTGLNRSVGALFRNVDGLLVDLGFQPAVKRTGETSTGYSGEIESGVHAESQAQISPAVKMDAPPMAPPAEVAARAADLPLISKGQRKVNLFSGPPPTSRPSLPPNLQRWLKENGPNLIVLGRKIDFTASEEDFVRRLQLLTNLGRPVLPVPNQSHGIRQLVGYMSFLDKTQPEKFAEILGVVMMSGVEMKDPSDRGFRQLVPPSKRETGVKRLRDTPLK